MFSGVLRGLLACFMLVALALSAGCGSKSTVSGKTGPKPNDGLIDLQRLLKEEAAANRPMPKKMADMTQLEGPYPAAATFVQNKAVVYIWGSGIDSGPGSGTTVIAYEAETPSNGGSVLLQDGTIKQMTAEEFKAATIAQVKK